MSRAGFVYALSNPAMPGLLKIGMTTKSPVTRAEELRTTGVPQPFVVEFAIYVSGAAEMERYCHERFAEQRCSPDREFFRLHPSDVAVFVMERHDTMDGFNIISGDECASLVEVGLEMNCVSHRHMHPIEVASALELLTADELRMLALRYDAHCDQSQAKQRASLPMLEVAE